MDVIDALPPWVCYLVEAGTLAPSADNGQPWRFWWDGEGLTLGFDPQRGRTGLGEAHPATQLAMGACVENVLQAAEAAHIDPNALNVLDSSADGGKILRVTQLGRTAKIEPPPDLPLSRRHTSRLRFKTDPLSTDLKSKIVGLTEKEADLRLFEDRSEINRISRLVRRASELRFRNSEIHQWLGASLRLTKDEVARGDGLDVKTLALPPGGGLLMKLIRDWRRMAILNALGAYKALAAVEAASLKQCAAILAISATDWSPLTVRSAGRLMERVWVILNEAGLVVHPYFVLSDQLYRLDKGALPAEHVGPAADLAADARKVFQLNDRKLAILLRTGGETAKAPRSARLSLSETVTCT